MGEVRTWLEGQLRRMLGFDEVEEIARFALDSFPASKPLELKQYLEQFLGQSKDVDKLCNDLSARRSGTPAAAGAAKNQSSASDDFWGAGAGSGPTRAAGSAPALSGRGGQDRKAPPAGRGKGKGKMYQKSAEEEDFWGGGTKSGRSTPAKGTATPASTPTPAGKPAPAPVRAAATSTQNRPKGNAKGGGKISAATTKPKPPAAPAAAYVQPPAASPASKVSKPVNRNAGQGKAKGGAPAGGAAATPKQAPALAAAVAQPAPQWSGVSCQCMGKTHDIVTNCTTCGKIACVVEGGFGCSFCAAALPRTGREPKSQSGGDNKGGGGASGGASGAGAAPSAALKEALERKDKLLLFDRTSASRTRVLDDQGDYFTSHNWLSQRERETGEAEEKARRDEAAKRSGARREVKLSIDIMGRRVVETKEAGESGGQEKSDELVNTAMEGLSLDFGASARGTSGGIEGGSVGGANTTAADEQQPPAGSGGQAADQRPSLENTGLRGRAKEVYDVMRANLDKQSRRQPSGKGGKGSRIAGGAGARAEKSRVSLWRVQHDVESEDVLRRSQPGADGGSGVGGFVSDGLDKFQPRDELACTSR